MHVELLLYFTEHDPRAGPALNNFIVRAAA